jgi:CubicO group peptidase (beta-lactamase class C family)
MQLKPTTATAPKNRPFPSHTKLWWKVIPLLLLLLTLTATVATATTPTDFDQEILLQMDQNDIPGLGVCIVKDGAVHWCQGYGWAVIDQLPTTEHTPFLIASISKLFTTVSLLQLRDTGAFALDDDINANLDFTIIHPKGGLITYRRLATHTAGIKDNWAVMDTFYTYGGQDPEITLEEWAFGYFNRAGDYYNRTKNFAAAPGRQFLYSNEGAALNGYLIETITGIDYAQYSQTNLLQPLALTNTSWRIEDYDLDTIAMPYTRPGGNYQPTGHYTFADYPNGGLRTSAHDLARFLAAIANGGILDGQRILAEDTVAEMLTIQPPPNDHGRQAIGWYTTTLNGETWIGHNGGELGVCSDLWLRQSDGLGIVLLANGNCITPQMLQLLIDHAETQ